MAKKRKKRSFSWQGALAGLGQGMVQNSEAQQRAALQQAQQEAVFKQQLELDRIRAEREVARNKILDEQWKQTFDVTKSQKIADDEYRANMLKLTMEDRDADNTLASDKFGWEKQQAQQKIDALKARGSMFGAIPPIPMPAGVPAANVVQPPPPVGQPAPQVPAGTAPPDAAAPPMTAPAKVNPIDAALNQMQQQLAMQQRIAQNPIDEADQYRAMTAIQGLTQDMTKLQLEQEDRKWQKTQDLHGMAMDMQRMAQANQKIDPAEKPLTVAEVREGMRMWTQRNNPTGNLQARAATEALASVMVNEDINDEKTQAKIDDLKAVIQASTGKVPTAEELYSLVRGYQTGQNPPMEAPSDDPLGILTP